MLWIKLKKTAGAGNTYGFVQETVPSKGRLDVRSESDLPAW